MILSIILVATVPLFATDIPDMSKYQSVRGSYVQNRYIKQVDAKLKSRGLFQVGRKSGVTWDQKKPFSSLMVISEDKVTFRSESGVEQTKSADPISVEISKMILSLFKNDREALGKNFNIKETSNSNEWNIQLLPKNKLLAKIIKSIEVRGNEFVSSVFIQEAGGGYIDLSFSDVKATK